MSDTAEGLKHAADTFGWTYRDYPATNLLVLTGQATKIRVWFDSIGRIRSAYISRTAADESRVVGGYDALWRVMAAGGRA